MTFAYNTRLGGRGNKVASVWEMNNVFHKIHFGWHGRIV